MPALVLGRKAGQHWSKLGKKGLHSKFLCVGTYRRCTGVNHKIAMCVFNKTFQPCYWPIWQYLYIKLFMQLQSFSSFLGHGACRTTPWTLP
eukprot:2444004-Rhodomonas_salina.2